LLNKALAINASITLYGKVHAVCKHASTPKVAKRGSQENTARAN